MSSTNSSPWERATKSFARVSSVMTRPAARRIASPTARPCATFELAEAVDVEHGDGQWVAVPAGAIDLGGETLMEAAQVRQAGQGVAGGAHLELALELAEPPVGVAQLLLEQPPLLVAVAEHVESIGKTAVYCTSGASLDSFRLVGPPARLHLGVGLRVVHLRRAEGDDLGPSGPASKLRQTPAGTRIASHCLKSTISSSIFMRPLPETTT